MLREYVAYSTEKETQKLNQDACSPVADSEFSSTSFARRTQLSLILDNQCTVIDIIRNIMLHIISHSASPKKTSRKRLSLPGVVIGVVAGGLVASTAVIAAGGVVGLLAAGVVAGTAAGGVGATTTGGTTGVGFAATT